MCIQILTVALWGTNGIEFEAMLRINLVAGAQIISARISPCSLVVTIACLFYHRAAQREPIVNQTRVVTERRFAESPRTQLLLNGSLTLKLGWIGHDIHRAANGWHGQVYISHAPLNLNGCCCVTDSVPVGPKDPAVLHVVDWYAVDHDSDIALVEAAYVDARIAGAAALFSHERAGIHKAVVDSGKIDRGRRVPILAGHPGVVHENV